MSVSNELGRVVSTATGGQTAFPFSNIAIFDDGDLLVYQNGTLLTLGADYSVSLSGTAPSDGTVTLVTGATADDVIIIERDIPRQQNTVYNPGTAFSAKSHENALDRNTLIATDLHTRINHIPQFERGYQANYSWRYTNMPDAVTTKIPVYDPATKTISWADADSGINTLDFSALTGTLDISGADVRIEEFAKSHSGAVDRTLQEHLSDWKTVKDFGAVGDGVTDDTDAIQAALDTAGHIYFPPGDYLISAFLTLSDLSRLEGAGMGVTRIFSNDDHSIIVGSNVSDVEISGMTFEGIHPGGTGSNTTNDGINITSTVASDRRIRIHDMHVKNMTGRGIVLVRHVADAWVYNNLVENCLIGIFLFGGNQRTHCYDNILDTCRVGGIYLDDATVGGVAGVDAFQPFFSAIHHNHIFDGGFDPANSGFGIAVSASHMVSVAGNMIDSLGDPGTHGATGITISSGQDDLFSMQNITVANNAIYACSSYGIYMEAVRNFSVTGNVLLDNHNWTGAVANASEILVRSHNSTATPSQTGNLMGNVIRNSGAANARSIIGIDLFDTTIANISLVGNHIINITTFIRSQADAGDLMWRGIEPVAALPTHDDGMKGRILYDTGRQLLVQSNGSQYSPVAPLAWCMFDGTGADPITISSGHNVTNVTKSATGVYQVNLSETLSNANYAAVASSSQSQTRVGTCTTTAVQITTEDDAGADADAARISLVIFGTSS